MPVNAIIVRFLDHVMEPVNCQLSIIANRQQRASGNRMSAIAGRTLRRSAGSPGWD